MIITETFFTMRDQVRLYTRIALPEEGGKYPVVFIRTPYEPARHGEPYPLEQVQDDLFLKNGYALITQHTRGQGDSEGDCTPYQEREDGLDSLDCIRALPFYNGEIYVTGGSYLSTVHLCYLGTNPHDVKAAALSIQTDRMYDRNYRNGCCYDFCNLRWWLSMLRNRYPVQKPLEEVLQRPFYKIMERAVGEDVPEYTGQLINERCNDFWQSMENAHTADRLMIPTLFTEGWYDFYIDGMFSMWERLPQETRAHSVFVVGPWGHFVKTNPNTAYPFPHGDVPQEYIVNFFNSIRFRTPYPDFAPGKVHYYDIGADRWTVGQPAGKQLTLYLNPDFSLRPRSCETGSHSYLYDPNKPLNCFSHHNIFPAHPAGSKDGVLSFQSAPFAEPVSFFGKLRVHIKVRSNCEDTAFFARVYMTEDGQSYNLTQTVAALSHIHDSYTPGADCVLDLYTPPIGFHIKKGCALRVDISSHSDLYVPHANVKGHWATVETTRIATNTLICDEDTFLSLPVCEP